MKLDPWETLCCLARNWKFTLIFTKEVKSACFALYNQCAICRLCLPEVWWWECKNELLKEWFISLVWFFFASISIRSSQNIYFGISLHVFWYKCCRFSMDFSQDFRSMWDVKSRLEFCLKCMKACCKVNSDYGLTMSAMNTSLEWATMKLLETREFVLFFTIMHHKVKLLQWIAKKNLFLPDASELTQMLISAVAYTRLSWRVQCVSFTSALFP